MSRWQVYLLLGLGIFALGLGTGLGVSHGHAVAKAQAAQTQSDQHEGAAQTHAAQATNSDRQGAANQAAVLQADARVAAAKRELAALQARLPKTAPVSIPSLPGIPDDSSPLEAAQQVIAAQDQEIAALKLQVSIEHASAIQWHQAYDESQKALALQRVASAAEVRAARSGGVRTALVRGLEGLAIGYVAGKVTK